MGWAVALAVGGALAAFLQARGMGWHGGDMALWIGASATSWGLSAIGLSIPIDMSSHLWFVLVPRNLLLPPAAAGILLGVVTGGVFLRLRR